MVLCPACGSSRIRNDYKPAPLALRIFGIRALLCDHCNHQFKAFSLQSPKSHTPRHPQRKAVIFTPAPAVNLNRLNGDVVEMDQVKAELHPDQPRRLTIDLDALRLQSQTQEEVAGAIVIDQVSPVRRDLRTEITRLCAQGAKDNSRPQPSESNHSSPASVAACTHCGSHNVKRRRRRLIERIVFSFTDHKAFACRSCGESFYAKVKDDKHQHSAIGATEALR